MLSALTHTGSSGGHGNLFIFGINPPTKNPGHANFSLHFPSIASHPQRSTWDPSANISMSVAFLPNSILMVTAESLRTSDGLFRHRAPTQGALMSAASTLA
jgi:hypothetical protein